MAYTINRVFYNPLENSSCGHSRYPSKTSTLQPPHPLGISIDHHGGVGGMGNFWNHTFSIQNLYLQNYWRRIPTVPQWCSKMSAHTVMHSLSPVLLQLMSSNQCALYSMRYTSAPQSCRQCQNLLFKTNKTTAGLQKQLFDLDIQWGKYSAIICLIYRLVPVSVKTQNIITFMQASCWYFTDLHSTVLQSCIPSNLQCWFSVSHHSKQIKIDIKTVQQINARIREMKGGKYAQTLVRSEQYFICEISGEMFYPNLQSFVWRGHACAHSDGHQHGGRKQQKHLSLSFATLKCEFMSPGTDNIKVILFLIFMSCSDSKIPFSAIM